MSEIVVNVRDVHVWRGSRPVLAGATFQVERGEVVALMGASGSGKTTILRTMAGLEAFEQGMVAIDGVTVEAGPPSPAAIRSLRRKVGMVFQFHCLFEHLPALQNV